MPAQEHLGLQVVVVVAFADNCWQKVFEGITGLSATWR